jgi:hypothetical protein
VPESKEDDFLHYNKDSVFWDIPASRRACPIAPGFAAFTRRADHHALTDWCDEDAVSRKGFE